MEKEASESITEGGRTSTKGDPRRNEALDTLARILGREGSNEPVKLFDIKLTEERDCKVVSRKKRSKGDIDTSKKKNRVCDTRVAQVPAEKPTADKKTAAKKTRGGEGKSSKTNRSTMSVFIREQYGDQEMGGKDPKREKSSRRSRQEDEGAEGTS